MKKIVLFVILDQYADWEAAYLSSLLLTLGQGEYLVKTVSLTKKPIRSIGGFTVLPDDDLQSVPTDIAGVVLVGGLSWRTEAAQQVKTLVQQALSNGKVVAGICDASNFLGAIGVLNTVNHTGNDLNELKEWAGEAYTGEEKYILQQAVRDGNIVTANGTASLEFAKEVMLALGVAPEAKVLEWYNFHKLGCYEAPIPSL